MAMALIGPAELARVAELRAHAAAHVYDVTRHPLPRPPGDDPAFVMFFGTVRVVYTHTLAPCARVNGCERRTHLFHHLSFSTWPRANGKLPNPVIVAELCKLFHVDFYDKDTAKGASPEECAVVVVAEVRRAG